MPEARKSVVEVVPSMIAMCTAPGGPHEHIAITSREEAEICFAGCDCKPQVYVRDDAQTRAIQAVAEELVGLRSEVQSVAYGLGVATGNA